VIATAIFMAFHTQIFIAHVEPNPVFSWLASGLIEGFLLVLAMSKRTLIRYLLLAFLYLISVVSASASFVVKNENLLESFFTQKRLIGQLQEDLIQTRKAYLFGEKYTTKTLQRERALMDELREVLKSQKGYLPIIQSVVFFIFCLALQTASVYTATTLKQGIETGHETPTVSPVSPSVSPAVSDPVSERYTSSDTPVSGSDTSAVIHSTRYNGDTPPETVSVSPAVIHPDTPTVSPDTEGDTPIRERVKELRRRGLSIRQIAAEMNISTSKVQRLLKG